MSALKAPKHTSDETGTEGLTARDTEAAVKNADGWQFGDLKAHGAGSPARKLQSHLAARLHGANRLPIRGTLATLAVLCLSMSVAGLYLMTFA